MIKLRVRITQIAKINMFWVYLLFVCVSVVCARIYKKVGHRCFFGHELLAQFRNHNLIFEWLLFKNWFNLKIYFQIQQLNFLQNVFFFASTSILASVALNYSKIASGKAHFQRNLGFCIWPNLAMLFTKVLQNRKLK